jgi:hypothetical protein
LVLFEGVGSMAKDVTKGVASGYTLCIFLIILGGKSFIKFK